MQITICDFLLTTSKRHTTKADKLSAERRAEKQRQRRSASSGQKPDADGQTKRPNQEVSSEKTWEVFRSQQSQQSAAAG